MQPKADDLASREIIAAMRDRVESLGGIFSFGDATFFGSTGAIHLNKLKFPAGGAYTASLWVKPATAPATGC